MDLQGFQLLIHRFYRGLHGEACTQAQTPEGPS